MKGGKAIASGGYGCVFYPALKCKNQENRTTGISKLLKKNAAIEEFEEAKKILPILQKIPNYKNKILLPHDICDPSPLESSDMDNLEEKCSKFSGPIKRGAKSYRILNMDFGGPDLDKYLLNNMIDSKFIQINNSLIQLIDFIHSFNEYNLVHIDIKPQNILVNEDTKDCKIIDWGLSFISSRNKKHSYDETIIDALEWKPIQFNVPPSNILFSEHFTSLIITELLDKEYPVEKLALILKNEYPNYKNIYDDGHYSYINNYIQTIIDNAELTGKSEDTLFLYLAHCCKYIINSIKQNEINKYFYEIFRYNCDIWGLLTCYIPLLLIPESRFSMKTSNQVKTFKKQLALLLYRYMIKCDDNVINIKSLKNELLLLNDYFTTTSTNKITVFKESKASKLPITNKPTNNVLDTRKTSIINLISSIKITKSKTKKNTKKNTKNNTEINKSVYKKCPKNTRKNNKGKCVEK